MKKIYDSPKSDNSRDEIFIIYIQSQQKNSYNSKKVIKILSGTVGKQMILI